VRKTRHVIGVALLVSLVIILCSGFARPSGQEFMFIMAGFAAGLITAYLVDHLRPRPSAAQKAPAHESPRLTSR
jgi:hypothetical protein